MLFLPEIALGIIEVLDHFKEQEQSRGDDHGDKESA